MGRPRALAAALASLLVATPVMAQPRPSPNRPPQDIASDLVKQAITKSQAGDHLGAIDLYLNAYSLLPQHLLLSNVGAEYQQAGKPIEALKYFCMYLEKDPTGTNATYALSKAKALQIELGNKNVDDKTACKPVSTKPTPPPEEDPPVDVTEVSGTKEPIGPKDGGEKSGGGGSGFKYTGVGAIVIGLAGVGAGLYFGRKAQEKSDLISNHSSSDPWPDDIRQIEADGQRYEDRQIQLTIAGSALAIAGGVLKSGSAERVSIRPTATPNSFGLAIGRGF
jgi:tetratricopeptide (TPR) repeat protein